MNELPATAPRRTRPALPALAVLLLLGPALQGCLAAAVGGAAVGVVDTAAKVGVGTVRVAATVVGGHHGRKDKQARR